MKLTCVREMKSRIQGEENLLRGLRERAESATSHLSATPKAKPLASKIETFAPLIVDSEKRLESLRADEIALRCDLLLEILERVKDFAAQEILLLRYVDCLKWQDIADRVDKSLPRCWQLHRIGVAEFGG